MALIVFVSNITNPNGRTNRYKKEKQSNHNSLYIYLTAKVEVNSAISYIALCL